MFKSIRYFGVSVLPATGVRLRNATLLYAWDHDYYLLLRSSCVAPVCFRMVCLANLALLLVDLARGLGHTLAAIVGDSIRRFVMVLRPFRRQAGCQVVCVAVLPAPISRGAPSLLG